MTTDPDLSRTCVMRNDERVDARPWHDGPLMDLLASELVT
jgi:hypothetical protein